MHYFSIEKTTLNPLKEILMYNTNQEFLPCFLRMINPFNRDLPHIATMGRDEILQQTPLKTLLDRIQYACQTMKFYAPLRPLNE
ncbi:cag pathogenicity island protein [Helicobacter pylori]|nr:cag pathogenicity island protein [Helicobacter pylori]